MKEKELRLTIEAVHVFKERKLAIKIPAGEIIEHTDRLDLDTMSRLFSKSMSLTLPLDKIMEIEHKIEPFRIAMNQKEDKAFVTITSIKGNSTNKPMISKMNDYNKLDTRIQKLIEEGYEVCGIYYAISVLMKKEEQMIKGI